MRLTAPMPCSDPLKLPSLTMEDRFKILECSQHHRWNRLHWHPLLLSMGKRAMASNRQSAHHNPQQFVRVKLSDCLLQQTCSRCNASWQQNEKDAITSLPSRAKLQRMPENERPARRSKRANMQELLSPLRQEAQNEEVAEPRD